MLVFNRYRFSSYSQSVTSETPSQDSSEVDENREKTEELKIGMGNEQTNFYKMDEQKPESSKRNDDDLKGNRKQIHDTERTDHHVPTPILPTVKKKYPQRRCVICRKNGAPRDTRYCCKACFEVPALCKTPCFRIYHCNFM